LFQSLFKHGLPLEITYDIVREYGLDVVVKDLKASEAHRIASGAGRCLEKWGRDAEQYGCTVFLKESKSVG
jgi:alanyl-tRNA synthetase